MTSPSVVAPDEFVEVNGTRVAYRSLGRRDGVPLVLLSRFRGTMDDWDPLFVDALAGTRPVILFDNAGIGRSGGQTPGTVTEMAEIAAAFIATVVDTPVDVLGFSLGGYVAQRLALAHPELVRRLVLAGTGPGAGEGILPAKPQVAPLKSAPQMDSAVLRALFFTESTAGLNAAKEVWERTHQHPNREPEVPRESYERQIEAIANWSSPRGDAAYGELGRLTLPVLVANGQDDIMIPTVNSFIMSQLLRNAQLLIYPDSGHGFLFQYAEIFARASNEFLDRPETAGAHQHLCTQSGLGGEHMDPLTVSSDRRAGWSVVEVAGELDIATADQLGSRLADVITAHSPARIVLDMSKVHFCDASGLRVLVHAHRAAHQRHGLLHLVCPKGKVRRLLRIAGLAEVIPAHATSP